MNTKTQDQWGPRVRIQSHTLHRHAKDYGIIRLTVRETPRRRGVDFGVEELLCASDRGPNVPNPVVYHLTRAIDELTELRADILAQGLYNRIEKKGV